MLIFGYTEKPVSRQIIRGDEHWLCLSLTPGIESLVIKYFSLNIAICIFIRNIAIDNAVCRYLDIFIVED